MKYYIISGEASGDLHGSRLIQELTKKDPAAVFRCWGGDKMQAAGATVVKHYRELAFMGFIEVLFNLRTILRNLKFCKEDILNNKPDVLVLIDYPGFNLRIAKWAKDHGFKVVYYISPQVWAWKESRVKQMKKTIDKMIVIIPFEKDYFKNKWDWEVEYVGHPLLEIIRKPGAVELRGDPRNAEAEKPVVAVLPGSRKQEILKKLPIMLEVTKSFPDYQFIIAKAPGIEPGFYDELLKPFPSVSYVNDKTYDLLQRSEAAIVTSGTATLETALFGVPQVVCYKASWITYQIGKRLVKVKYISLVNLIMDKPVVRELVQEDLTAGNLVKELKLLLTDKKRQEQIRDDYEKLRGVLDVGGSASEQAAGIVYDFLNKNGSGDPFSGGTRNSSSGY